MKLQNPAPALGYAASGMARFGIVDATLQAALFYIAVGLETVGGFALALGFDELASTLLLAFLVPVTVFLHTEKLDEQMNQVGLLKNVALIGALLYIYASSQQRKESKSKSH